MWGGVQLKLRLKFDLSQQLKFNLSCNSVSDHTIFCFAKNHVLLDTIHTVQISYSINKLPLWIHDASITKKQTVILRKYNKLGTSWVEVGAKGSGVE